MPADTILLTDYRTSGHASRRFFLGHTWGTELVYLFRANIIPNTVPSYWGGAFTWLISDEGQRQEIETISSCVIPIQTLAPEPYKLIKPFLVILEKSHDQYISSFLDANISASGDTREESILNFKDILLGTFDLLSSLDEDELGPMPLKQYAILKEYIKPK